MLRYTNNYFFIELKLRIAKNCDTKYLLRILRNLTQNA